MKLNLYYIIIAFVFLFFSAFSQTKGQKIKETFQAKNYQLTIDEINSMNSSEIHFDSILYLKAYSQIKLNQLKDAAKKCDKKLLREINLFDVYEGKNLEPGKKSYALSFIFQDQERTLTDAEIDASMAKIKEVFEKDFGAVLR